MSYAEIVHRVTLLKSQPPEWLVHDEPSPCPYLPGQVARLPMRVPTRQLSPPELSAKLEEGDRRQGVLLYRPKCPNCQACEAIRIPIETFRERRSHRRVLRRGDAAIEMELGRPMVNHERIDLYNRHKIERDLLIKDELLDIEGYKGFLVESCTETIELRLRVGGRLIGIAVSDLATDSISAVYCFFDPDFEQLSPGTFSILKQIELCRRWNLRYLYLGLYVADCAPLAYKAKYLPHERRIGGVWQRFES